MRARDRSWRAGDAIFFHHLPQNWLPATCSHFPRLREVLRAYPGTFPSGCRGILGQWPHVCSKDQVTKAPKVEAGMGEWRVGAGGLKSQELAWGKPVWTRGPGGSVWVPVSGRVASAFWVL